MIVKRNEIQDIENLIYSLANKKFDIKTQYKFIKIKKAIKQEQEIYNEQLQINCQEYFEKDSNGNPLINEDGGFKIKKDKLSECYLMINKMNNLDIQLPDVYFNFDELEPLDLTLEQLSFLEPFIKN